MADKRPTLENMWFTLDVPGVLFEFALGRKPLLSYECVQALLDRFDCAVALVEFFVVPDGVFIFVLRSGERQPTFVEWLCPRGRLEYLLTTYHHELVEYPRYGTEQRWQQVASPLLQDVLPALKGVDLVYLIPHDVLSYLPLHALRANGGHLIDQFPIVYAPSADVFTRTLERLFTAGEAEKVQTVLVAGNPTFDLEHAEDEAKWVASYFGGHPYLGREATKVKARSQLADKDLIHLACHGFFHAYEPLESGLLMAGKRTLNVHDIKTVKIRADLVTLSACESALISTTEVGKPVKSRGLRLAFLESGASSVLGTLWSVADESTTLLISDFYQRLYNGAGKKINTKARALQQAMLALREQKEHPYYWAAYTLTGSWR